MKDVKDKIERITLALCALSPESLSHEYARLSVNANRPPIILLPEETLLKPPQKKWRERSKSMTIPDYIEKYYGDRLGHGFHRGHLRHIDFSFYEILGQWLHKNTMPEHIYLPTEVDWNDVLCKAFSEGRIVYGMDPSRYEKLGQAMARRRKKLQKKI